MTQEQLTEAIDLSDRIKSIKHALRTVEDAYEFLEVHVRYKDGDNSYTAQLNTAYLNFEAFKAITLAAMQRKLNELETKFAKL